MSTIVTEYQGSPIDHYDSDKVDEAAQAAAANLLADPDRALVIDLQPGNGTRYVMVITPLSEAGASLVGNTHILSFPLMGKCYPVNVPGYQVPSYVQEKWLPSISDAVPVSQFLISLGKSYRGNA